MPFKVASGASFFAGPASGNGVAYFEWTNPKLENTVHHFHFLGPDHAGDRQELVLCGSACGGPDVYFSFHINQVRKRWAWHRYRRRRYRLRSALPALPRSLARPIAAPHSSILTPALIRHAPFFNRRIHGLTRPTGAPSCSRHSRKAMSTSSFSSRRPGSL